MANALREALAGMNSGGSERPTGPQEDERGEKEHIGGGELHSVHHHNHKESGKHSVHHISHDGTAKSTMHEAGQGGETCPLCGGSGEAPQE